MDLSNFDFSAILLAFFGAWQVKALLGLILLDFGLGAAAALRSGKFEFTRLAQFYQTNVLPYVLGFLVLFVAISYVLPVTPEGGTVIDLANQATINVAWAALVANLAGSIMQSFNALYNAEPPSGTLR